MSDPLPTVRRDCGSQKRRCLLGLAVLAALWGAASVFIGKNAVGDKFGSLVVGLLGVGLAFTWLYYDSLERQYHISTPLGLAIILVAGVGIPFYFFKTRGWRGFISLGLALLVFVGLAVVACLSNFAVYYAGKSFAH